MLGAPARIALNGTPVSVDGMQGFMRKYVGSPPSLGAPSSSHEARAAPLPSVPRRELAVATPMAQLGQRWQVGVALSPQDDFAHVSFVNGVSTPRGGTHVDHVASAVLEKVVPKLAKQLKLKPNVTARSTWTHAADALAVPPTCATALRMAGARPTASHTPRLAGAQQDSRQEPADALCQQPGRQPGV